jgi:geranylgeranyl reductase family protein
VRCDVAVVGAGPAGSVAAAMLARRGATVALVDASHPREKPCGGGLTGRALALVGHLVPATAFPAVRIRAARFLDTARALDTSVPLPQADAALVVASRTDLDTALFEAAQHAGATVVRERVTEISVGPPHLLSTSRGTRIECTFLIGADGANSLVRRRFSSAFRREQLSLATGFFARGCTSDEIVLEMMDAPSGYIWSFPRPDHLAIGICAQATDTTVGALRQTLSRWIAVSGVARGARLEQYSWPIPSLAAGDFHHLPLGGDGWLTIGDAAGLVDPITREGIFFALQSALFAADALASGSATAARAYAARVRDEISCELRAAAALKAGFFRPQFTRLMGDALASSAKIRRVMADLVAGTQSYRTLKRRLVGTLELGLAWRWLREVQHTASWPAKAVYRTERQAHKENRNEMTGPEW